MLIGEKLEEDKYYAYHFMLKMDMSFRDVLSTREDGCLKRMKTELTKKVERWALVLVNVQYILRLVLGALGYIHSQKLVHCEIKGLYECIRLKVLGKEAFKVSTNGLYRSPAISCLQLHL